MRHVQARPGTLRKNAAAAAAAQQKPPVRSDRDLPPPPVPGVRSRDYAATPQPPAPHARPPRDQPAFETVRKSIISPPPSAHSEYSDYSTSPSVPNEQRPRVELDREKERIERERLVLQQREQQQRAQVARPDSWASSEDGGGREEKEEEEVTRERTPTNGRTASEEDEEGGSILDTVVLPVLDSVSSFRSAGARRGGTGLMVRDWQIHNRVTNPAARTSILKLRRAIEQAEREVPGLLNVLVSEIVDSVEVRSRSCEPSFR